MPEPVTIEKAFLQEITWDKEGQVNSEGRKVAVQFNPESLKISFTNQIAGDDNNGGSAIQFASRGTTKLSFEMWFDVTARQAKEDERTDDVRRLTAEISAFMQTKPSGTGKDKKYTPPGCRFQWGSFLFEGVMESVSQTIEFFSPEGKPLRSSVSVSLTKQDVEVRWPPAPATPGTEPEQEAREADSVQEMSARQGAPEGWQDRARNAGVEDPLRVPTGTALPSLTG